MLPQVNIIALIMALGQRAGGSPPATLRRMRALISALLAANALMLAGCTTPAPVKYIPTSEPFCQAVQTTCISKDDVLTEPTAQSIEANNLGRAKVCKRQVKCAQPKPTS